MTKASVICRDLGRLYDAGTIYETSRIHANFHVNEFSASSCVFVDQVLFCFSNYETARSVISRPRSMIANASRNSASVMHNGGLVKNVFHLTKV